MARPRTDQRVVDEIIRLVVNPPKRTGEQIRILLERWARENGFEKPIPSVRQIARIKSQIQAERQSKSSDQKWNRFRQFYFPESMERGELPWEAGKAGLDLVQESYGDGGGVWRPPVGVVEWYWRLSIAAPDCPSYIRILVCKFLMGRWSNLDDSSIVRRVIEFCFVNAVWRMPLDWDARLLKIKASLSRHYGEQEDLLQQSWEVAESFVAALKENVEEMGGKEE